MAAKTGTVGPAVTLAGMIQTKKGTVLFMYNIATRATERDWAVARRQIAANLAVLAKKYNGGLSLEGHAVKFVAFDPEFELHNDIPVAAATSPKGISNSATPFNNFAND